MAEALVVFQVSLSPPPLPRAVQPLTRGCTLRRALPRGSQRRTLRPPAEAHLRFSAPGPQSQARQSAGLSALTLALVSTEGRLGSGSLTVPLCPLLTGTSSTSSWTPPWACCSSTWGCVPSVSWWSGSSGSPCALANMVTYQGHWRGMRGIPRGAPCLVQPSRPVDSETIQELVAVSSMVEGLVLGPECHPPPASECPRRGMWVLTSLLGFSLVAGDTLNAAMTALASSTRGH